MYGDWQIGHMPLAKYVEKHREVVDAMRAEDPKIAAGRGGRARRVEPDDAQGRELGHMTYLSEHLYWQDKPDVPAHVAQARDGIRKVAEDHRAYRRDIPALEGQGHPDRARRVELLVRANEYGELGTRYFLQDGLGIAAGLHELFRNSDIFLMANYAQTVNVIGAIKTTPTAAEMETTGLALALYRRRFGTLPVRVTGVDLPLDVAAAWTADKRDLTVAIVNPTSEERRLALDLRGARLDGRARRFVMAGPDPWAYNAPGRPRGVEVARDLARGGSGGARLAALVSHLYVLPAN